jgi:hypothetical protein
MDKDKEEEINDIMRASSVTRAEAEFIYAQEAGEITSDVIVVDENGEDI